MNLLLQLIFIIACFKLAFTTARCLPRCDDTLMRMNYIEHLNTNDTLVFNNVSVDLRDGEGSTDDLEEFAVTAQVCPWHYESNYNSSRLPQVMYTAVCDAETWCDHTTGNTYKCLAVDDYRVPIALSKGCDIFTSNEWTLSFENIAVSCYPSLIEMDTQEPCQSF